VGTSRHWSAVVWVIRCCIAAAAVAFAQPSANAQVDSLSGVQVILPVTTPTLPPWSAQRVFEPLPFPQYWDRESREALAPEDTPVKTRQQPGYESVGIRYADWMIHPTITLGSFVDSNVFSTSTSKRSDLALVVHPSVSASTLWERHAVDLSVDLRSTLYRANPGLDETDANVKARGRIDISHDVAVLMSFQAAHLNEDVGSLSSPSGAVQPTPYDLFSGDVTYRQEFNRLTASAGARVNSYSYGLTRAQDGSIINQNSRDGQTYALHGRLDYAFSPMLGFFSALEGDHRDLRGLPIQSFNSDGFRTLSGLSVEFTHLLMGEFSAGYTRRQFDDASIGTAQGPTYRGMLIWSPTRLVDITFQAAQMVTQATETDVKSIKATAFQFGLDYELRRNVVISLAGNYETDDFLSQVRTDRVYSTLSELKYLMNRYSSISLQHKFIRRDSSIPLSSYDKQEIGINVTAQF
jgi:hypothetical protein